MRQPARVPRRRHGGPAAGGDADLDLQLVVARPDRVPRRPRRGVGGHRRGRRVPRAGPRGARPTCPRCVTSSSIEPVDRPRRRVSGTTCSPAAPLDLERGGRRRRARRPRHDHLHVGHHRAAQGRDARPPQHLLDGREPPRGARLRRSTGSRIVSYLPMAHIAERMTTPLRRDRVRATRSRPAPTSGSLGALLARGAPADPLRCAAHVGEDPQRGAGRARRRSRSRRGVRAGARGRRARSPSTALAVRRCPCELAARVRDASTPSRCGRPRQLLGLDELRIAVTGAAPIPVEVLAVLPQRSGVPLSEIYGMSESTGPDDLGPGRG